MKGPCKPAHVTNFSDIACPVCGSSQAQDLFVKDEYQYKCCIECDHAWIGPLPEQDLLNELYGTDYFENAADAGYDNYARDEIIHRKNARKRLELIAQQGIRMKGNLLDIGCATGFFMDEARNCGYHVKGVDISHWARSFAKNQYRFEIHSDINELKRAKKKFDLITLFQVLEHSRHPDDLLENAFSLLSSSGAIVIETWDRRSLIARLSGRNWQQVSPPSVVHLFSHNSLIKLLRSAGLGNIKIVKSSKHVSLGFVSSLLSEKYPGLFKPFAGIVKKLHFERYALPYKLGDLITVFAYK